MTDKTKEYNRLTRKIKELEKRQARNVFHHDRYQDRIDELKQKQAQIFKPNL